MKITNIFAGEKFLLLISSGMEFHRRVNKCGDVLLRNTSPDIEMSLISSGLRSIHPKFFSVLFLLPFFLILYVCGIGMILQFFDLSIELSATLFFSLILVISPVIGAVPIAIGIGNVTGLFIILFIYSMDVLLTLTVFFCVTIKSMEISEWPKQMNLFPLQIILVLVCRRMMNSNYLSEVITFYRKKRLAMKVHEIQAGNKCEN